MDKCFKRGVYKMKIKNIIMVLTVMLSLITIGCPRQKSNTPVDNKQQLVKADKTQVEIPFTFPVAPLTKTSLIILDYFSFSGNPIKGVVKKCEISVSPNSAKGLDVKLTGSISANKIEWKTAMWVAALNSAFAVGRDITEYSISIKGSGVMDGPGSGALFSAGIMAGMTGHKIKSDVLLLGSVNPDGTIGPVSDIPEFLRVAAKFGKKVVGYPAGQKTVMDFPKFKPIDIEELAKTLGIKVVAMDNIYDGFELLTGKEFPRPPSLSKEKMAFGSELKKILKSKTVAWAKMHKDYSVKFKKEKLNKISLAAKKFEVSVKYFNKAKDLGKTDNYSTIYNYSQRSGGFAFSSYWYGLLQKRVLKSKKISKNVSFIQNKLEKPLFAALSSNIEKITSMDTTIASQFLTLVSSYQELIAALVYGQEGKENIKESLTVFSKTKVLLEKMGKKANKKELAKFKKDSLIVLNRALTRLSISRAKELKSQDYLGFKRDKIPQALFTQNRVQLVTEILEKVGKANLDYINFVVARKSLLLKKDVSTIKQQFFRNSNNYLLAFNSVDVARKAFARVSNTKAMKYYKMAGALSSFINSQVFMAKEYSLGVNKDPQTGAMKSVNNEAALEKMVVNAEKQARVYANLALMTSGSIPVMSKYYYGIAQKGRGGFIPLKIKSIELFWRSTMESRLAILLSR
jgi:uncharacterized protein